MLTLTNIKKVFKTDEVETWALQNVNLEVKKGEFVAIMGPSGCGKSTLLNILGLLDTPTEGAYILDGKDVSQMSEDDRTDLRKGKLGFVFQSFNLIDELNVSENSASFSIASRVAFSLKFSSMPPPWIMKPSITRSHNFIYIR